MNNPTSSPYLPFPLPGVEAADSKDAFTRRRRVWQIYTREANEDYPRAWIHQRRAAVLQANCLRQLGVFDDGCDEGNA